MTDNPKKAAVLWGPLVLAGDLGAAPRRRDDGDGDGVRAAAPDPVALVTDRPVGEWLKPVGGKPGVFQASGIARTVSSQAPIDVEFSPFFSMHRRTYARVLGRAHAGRARRSRARELAAETERMRALEAATISSVSIGDREVREKIQSAGCRNVSHPYGWPEPAGAPSNGSPTTCRSTAQTMVTLVATYNSDQRRPRSFDVLVDGQRLGLRIAAAEQRLEVL